MRNLDNRQTMDLCISLMKADTEEIVIDILKLNDLWDNPNYWRYYGDTENNYSSAGNQADEAEAALIEKITNSRDAILMNECLLRNILPESREAPQSVKGAVAKFFDEDSNIELAGQIREWDAKKRREIARKISVYITGHKPAQGTFPSINIADMGEGQTPRMIPKTILSLGKSIKLRIPFAHGKFNMGGTAALVYCGNNNLQFVLSRRNQALLNGSIDADDKNWGFTIIRREDPIDNLSSSIYKYLAPINSSDDPCVGDLLNFSADDMPIFAKYNEPYSTSNSWGTLIKLYEYETRYKQNVQGNGGLLRPLDLLAPDLGLPFRLHECRYEGTPGSFEHQMNGLRVRLFDDKGSVLEEGYPTSDNTIIEGEEFSVSVYAFKDDKGLIYRDSDKGVIFTLNGQSQGWLDDRIFQRKSVSLGFLRKSLLVMVDCSNLNYRAQERLFVNDRVHLRKGPFRDKIINAIEDYLGNHDGLAKLQEERKRKLKSERLEDSKPLEAVLSNVFKHSTALSKIFLRGERLSNAFRTESVGDQDIPFAGVEYPTYFKFKKIGYGEVLCRDVHIESKCRITFETDAENRYLIRKSNPGSYKLYFVSGEDELSEAKLLMIDHSLRLHNGIATLSIDIDKKYDIGDNLKFRLVVTDPMRIIDPPFDNEFILTLIEPLKNKPGKASERRKPPSPFPDDRREIAGGISFPELIPVYEKDFGQHGMNKYSALKAIKGKTEENVSHYIFLINRDNIYLQHEIKQDFTNQAEITAYFDYGMSLVGISLIYDDEQNKKEEELDNEYDVEDKIEEFTRSISPILIPMIKEFGELDLRSELLKELSE